MILLDTSVLIAYLRTGEQKIRRNLRAQQVAACGVTRAEILHGAKNDADYRRLTAILDAFAQVGIPADIWDPLGRHLFMLRTHGLSVPFPDAIIAAVAIREGLELWARDAHFALMQPVLRSLRLYSEV